MRIRAIFITIIYLLTAVALNAQTGGIKGKVTTSEGKPAEFVNITLEKKHRGTVVNESGRYSLLNVPAGAYTLIASFTGLETQKRAITVRAGEVTIADFVLPENNQQLTEVVVKSAGRLNSKQTEMVARMSLKNLENPQVYSVVGKELMKEQLMTDIREPFRAAPGVVATEYVTGSFGAVFRGFTGYDYARNGLSTSIQRSGTEIANLERMEFIKGPSATLFGSQVSSFGGVMNLVTKKPYAAFGGEVGYSFGSFDLSRVTVDVNTPLNKEKTVLFRLNAANHLQNSPNEYGKTKRYIIAPSLSYQASDRLTFLFDFEYFRSNATRLPLALLFADNVPFRSGKDIPLGFRQSFFQNDMLSDAQAIKYFAQARYQLSKNWTSTTVVSYVNEFLNHSYQPYVAWLDAATAVTSVRHFGPRERTSANFQQNFNGTFNTGRFQHNLLVGASYEYNKETVTYKATPDIDTIDMRKPFKKLNKDRVDRILANSSSPATNDAYGGNALGVYVSDVISWTDRLSTMLSLRFDRFEQEFEGSYVQPSLSPKLGVVYQLVKGQVSLFGNFMNGFQNQGTIEQPDGSLFIPKPVFANQIEGGIKAELPGNVLAGSISYYRIGINNAIRTGNDNFSFQDGRQESKGVEVELTGSPVAGLNVITGYSYNENKFTKADKYEGKFATGAPQHIANYWISYRLPLKSLTGIGVGFGGNYVSDAYFNAANTYVIPAYHVMNATVFYKRDKWNAGFKLNNIGNVYYWDMNGNPQFTRNFVCNFAFRF